MSSAAAVTLAPSTRSHTAVSLPASGASCWSAALCTMMSKGPAASSSAAAAPGASSSACTVSAASPAASAAPAASLR
ncbi:MAG: hypothetical protein R2755_15215 [Acidimicrobiales bacterium]